MSADRETTPEQIADLGGMVCQSGRRGGKSIAMARQVATALAEGTSVWLAMPGEAPVRIIGVAEDAAWADRPRRSAF